jgi:transketolase
MTAEEMTQLAMNTIRTLSIDAVQQAKSGHSGTLMALAPLIYTIWNRVMRFDPGDPIWPNRDRFVLSNGHASMLLWSVLHLPRTKAVNANYQRLGQASVSLDDIRRFRQLRVAVEQASTFGWERYVGGADCVIGMKTFGASAPLEELQRKFGFEPDQVVTVAKDLLSRSQRRHASVAA